MNNARENEPSIFQRFLEISGELKSGDNTTERSMY